MHFVGTTAGIPASNSEDAGHCGRTLCPLLAPTQHLPSRLRLEDVSINLVYDSIYNKYCAYSAGQFSNIMKQFLLFLHFVVGLLLDWRM
jgi:hypothetical protein